MEEFQEAMKEAKRSKEITLTVAVYKGGKSKLDELYILNSNKNQQVKNLLSNMFGGGLHNDARSINDMSSQTASSVEDEDDLDSYTDAGDKSVGDEIPEVITEAETKIAHDIPLHQADAKYNFDYLDFEKNPDDSKLDDSMLNDIDGDMVAPKKKVNRDDKEISVKETSFHIEDKGVDDEKKVYPEIETKEEEIVAPSNDSAEDDDQSAVSRESNDSWNYMTKVEDQVFLFTSIVCMPPELKASSCWGDPKKYIQFSNFSIGWKLEVNWVDEDGALIIRGDVKSGTSHFELCSTDHVWVIVATPIKSKTHGSHGSVSASKLSSNESVSHASLVSSVYDSPPLLLIIRPSAGSLRDGKCASVLWSPWSSMSVTQTMYSQPINHGTNAKIQPGIHIQLFDTTKKEIHHSYDPQEAKESDINLGKLTRRPLRKSRDVYRRKKTS